MTRELTLRDYLKVLWSGRTLLLVIIVASLVIGAIVALAKPVRYSAESIVSLGQATTSSGSPVRTPYTDPVTAPTTLKTDEMIRAVATTLDLKPATVRQAVHLSAPRAVSNSSQPTVLTVTATNKDRKRSITIANAYADQVLKQVGETFRINYEVLVKRRDREYARIERLNTEIAGLRKQLESAGPDRAASLQAALYSALGQLDEAQASAQSAELDATKAAQIEAPQTIAVADSASSSGTFSKRLRSILLAGIVGLLIGVIATFIWKGSPGARGAGKER